MTKYEQLANELKNTLQQNLKQGITKLPTEAELSQHYQLSRQTVRQALALLEKEGLITKIQGSGAYATGLSPRKETNHIALLLSSDSEYIYPSLLQKLQSALKKEGYDVSVYITQNKFYLEKDILMSLLSKKLRGIIVEPVKSALPNPNSRLYERFAKENIPIIFLQGYYSNFSSCYYVKEDNYMGSYQLAQHLLHLGHSQFAGIFKVDSLSGAERYLGCNQALNDQGVNFYDEHILWFNEEQLFALQKKQDTSFLLNFIQQNLTSCSAVLCHNDEIAYWLIKLLSRSGVRVPEDISVTGFENSYLSTLSAPTITTIGTAAKELPATAVELLINKLKGRQIASQTLSPQFYQGGSSGHHL